jgi:Tol biopolymer transport system component
MVTGSGTNRLQLISTKAGNINAPAITRDGTRVVFESNMNPFGTNPDGGLEIFRMQADGTGLFQVTSLPSGGASEPSITADGNTIAFTSSADIAGQNPGGYTNVFRINADGTGVQRLTSVSYAFDPQIAANGSVVVYSSLVAGTPHVVVANTDGTEHLEITDPAVFSWKPSVDDTGTWMAFTSAENFGGGVTQIHRMRTDGSDVQVVTTDTARGAFSPEFSGTGTRIVYFSIADYVGSNPNHYDQLFTYDATTSQTYQVTASIGVGSAATPAAISGDGNWVFWLASAPWTEPNPNSYVSLYRVPSTGGPAERIGAMPTPVPGGTFTGFEYTYKPRTDMTGTRILFDTAEDPTGQNPDYTYELWMVDMAREPEIRVSPTAPTLVSWDYEAGPIRYDVIRGDVANLAPGSPGTVSLGPVTCLENDSPDADTRGFEDAVTPPPGHAFFFLFRGSRGLNFGPGSWGQASGGAERVPGSGVCEP